MKNAFENKIRRLQKYTNWKNAILKRDVLTYPVVPKNLQVHHLISVQRILREYNIKTIEDAKKCKKLWNVTNGITLTKGEHLIITWLNRKKSPSKGLLQYLKWYIETNHEYYDWCAIELEK